MLSQLTRLLAMTIDILISTIGTERLAGMNAERLPSVSGVRYIIGCQCGDADADVVKASLERLCVGRADMSCVMMTSRGLSRNRNALMALAAGDIVMFGDDDIGYDAGGLATIRQMFAEDGTLDVIVTRVHSETKTFGGDRHRIIRCGVGHGFYAPTYALAVRRTALQGLRFCEELGVGSAGLPAGEDDIFLFRLLSQSRRSVYVPLCVARHHGLSTDERCATDAVLQARGLVLAVTHRHTWLVRILRLSLLLRGMPWHRRIANLWKGAVMGCRHRGKYLGTENE